MKDKSTIGEYLIRQLYNRKIRHIFGIPGDYVLGFYSLIEGSKIEHIGTTREDAAGFAADAYARVNGLGAICVTYCVGGLNVVNPVAGAYAEKSPVVVISGAPGMKEREKNPLLHHKVRDFSTQKRIFEHITVASTVLDDQLTAFYEIDRVLDAAMRYKRPVYIEIPRDMVDVKSRYRHKPLEKPAVSERDVLEEAIKEAVGIINASERPVILAGVEVHRFGLQDKLAELVDKTDIPVAATLLGKSVISEAHPRYIGIYEGAMGREEVRRFVETSDCVIMLGTFMSDINLGIYTANLDRGQSIYATSERIALKYHSYEDIRFEDFVCALVGAKIHKYRGRSIPKPKSTSLFKPKPDQPVTVRRLFERLDEFIQDGMVVISDIGDCLFGSVDLAIQRRTDFISPAYYTSMGFGLPASVGAQLANPKLRPLVLVGDGAFQMTGLELSTTVRFSLNPIVVVLNNQGYSTERHIQEGPYNDITNWNFSRIPDLLGAGWGFEVNNEGDLEKALQASLANQDTFSIIDIHLDKLDRSPALERLSERLGGMVKG